MTEVDGVLEEQYRLALRRYVSAKGEEFLAQAYVLGRNAVERGLGILNILRLHEDALKTFSADVKDPVELQELQRAAAEFLAESISPYEMTHRGFQEAIVTLRTRAEELISTNAKLKEEIRERKQAESSLRESEERYRKLVDTARDVIYTVSIDGKITSLNPSFELLTGWLRSEWLGKPFQPLVHPDDLELAFIMFKRVLEGDSPPLYEVRIRSKGGGYLVGEFVTTPQFRGGKIVGVLGIGRDVTARKRAEELLREHEELFRVITDNSTDLIAIIDMNGKRHYVSPSYRALLGEPESLLGSDSFSDVHPDDRERVKAAFQETIISQVAHREEYRMVTATGAVRHVESQWNVVRDNDGKAERVVKVSRDITERKIADEKLRHRERQLAQAQQLAHIGSWEWDLVSNTINWSDEMCRIYGFEPDGFGRNYEEYLHRVHPDDREMAAGIVQEALSTGKAFTFEHRIVQPGGQVRVLEAHGETVHDLGGNIVKMVGTGQDITERKKVEATLQMLAKRVVEAEEKERHRISRELHDNICQKLSATKMKLETLETKIKNHNSSFYRDLQQGRREVAEMVNEIRQISANLRPTALDDLGLVSALQVLTREFSNRSKLKIDFVADQLPARRADINVELALLRIAQEALANVAKHARAKNVSLQLTGNNGTIAMTVRDDGKGFDIEGRRNRKGPRGLGLVNMEERAMLVGGRFSVTALPRKGTSIHVEIPLRKNHETD